jgi:hypothetical protein
MSACLDHGWQMPLQPFENPFKNAILINNHSRFCYAFLPLARERPMDKKRSHTDAAIRAKPILQIHKRDLT